MIKSTGLSVAGARAEFFGRYDKVAVFPWERFAPTFKSDKERELHRWLGSLPMVREFGTGRLAKGLRSEAYDVVNQKYEATIEWDRDEIDDDQTQQIRMKIRQLATAAKRHPSRLLADLLANGGTSGYNSYDGVTFFNTAHVSGDSGNQDNALTATAAAATKTTAECKTAVTAAIAALLGYKDDQGQPLNEEVGKITVVVPPTMLFPMKEAVGAAFISQTSNILSAENIDVLPFPRLTVGTDFFTCALDDPDMPPFIFQDRSPMEFKSFEADGDSEEAFMREKGKAGVRARHKMTYAFWQKINRTRFNN